MGTLQKKKIKNFTLTMREFNKRIVYIFAYFATTVSFLYCYLTKIALTTVGRETYATVVSEVSKKNIYFLFTEIVK
jgi:hypothetical protein